MAAPAANRDPDEAHEPLACVGGALRHAAPSREARFPPEFLTEGYTHVTPASLGAVKSLLANLPPTA